MNLALGVDTGGTYTDAVLIRDQEEVIASAKALTTRYDLAEGIGNAVAEVIQASGVAPKDVGMAALSTTLATNALVEGQGGRVALVYIGFGERDFDKHGLANALQGDPVLHLQGGHDHAGQEAKPLDIDALSAWLETVLDVSGFAVAAQFATRNPAHENTVAEMIRDKTGRPVSCSHHLSAKLNGPKRALTALLNARLIGMIDGLIRRAGDKLHDLGIPAPLMVVRGDGALIGADFARERPIETILSGPAASIVGAGWLTGVQDALVSDIGGTTTDVALLRGGKPAIDPDGARVGPYRTMVEAVAMRTTGLGGDSEVHVVSEGLDGGVFLGPKRLVPVSLLAEEAPDVVMATLDEQSRRTTPSELDARFVRPVFGVDAGGLSARDKAVFDRVDGVKPVSEVLRTRIEVGSLKRLQERGLVQIGGVTPSDAAHVLGLADAWDAKGAELALGLMARRRIGSGQMLADGPESLARMIVEQLTKQTSLALLESAFAEEDDGFDGAAADLARHELLQRALLGHKGLLRLDAAINIPVVGLGASAPVYYPAVGESLHCEMVLPTHAGVANAIGAVVGRVSMRRSGTVTSPAEGRYRVHLETGPEDFPEAEAAMLSLERVLTSEAEEAARASGAGDLRIQCWRDIRHSQVEGRDVFIEATITAEASGRPRIATDPV
ncbi:hydantoinase/oxoprolinase family protein [Alisedimentitalea sp. MJ-SS2]|uniref:hydantoinase/oxoprolinase family protein n=1 Tax=Aliisedimentitalea sp. MJ-SS2 TaxID=3049795 RepID=UPI00290C4F86|nr:hydantoinase/oxoprolinase family protein [Alisedimentitalea sp. MJ-SS2]MDU8927988.1 hydantoinase/oxoprolinase family protein [Alisedimentitalea sp. MJ-SS2]